MTLHLLCYQKIEFDSCTKFHGWQIFIWARTMNRQDVYPASPIPLKDLLFIEALPKLFKHNTMVIQTFLCRRTFFFFLRKIIFTMSLNCVTQYSESTKTTKVQKCLGMELRYRILNFLPLQGSR